MIMKREMALLSQLQLLPILETLMVFAEFIFATTSIVKVTILTLRHVINFH